MHINRKPISESVEDAIKDKNPNVKRMRSLKPQPHTDIVMADALEASDEFDAHTKKVFGDLEKQSKNLTPKEPTTGKKVNRKPYTEGFMLNEDLFEDTTAVDEALDISNDDDFDIYSDLNSDVYNALADVLYEYQSKGTRVSPANMETCFEWFLTHFFDDDGEYLDESLHEDLTGCDVTISYSAEDYFDEDDDAHSYIGSNGTLISHDRTSDRCKVRFSDGNTITIPFEYLEIDESCLDESKINGKKSKHMQKASKKSSKLNEARFDDDKADYDAEIESSDFWSSRTTPKATMGRIADILLNVQDYLAHYYGDEGLYYFNNDFLPKAIDSGIKFGIDSDKLQFVKNWFDSGSPEEMSKEIWSESYDTSKSKSTNQNKHIQKASKKSSKLKEAKIEGNDLWQAYGEDDDEPEQDTVYDFANERLFGVNYSGFINSGNYRATNKFCRDVWVNLIKPKGAVSARKNFYYPDNLAGGVDFDGRESKTESRRAPTSEGLAVYLRDESEDTLIRAVADELELDYKIKPIGSYNKTNYKYIATIVMPDYIAEMPIDEYLTAIGKSISDYKGPGRGHRATKRELVAV